MTYPHFYRVMDAWVGVRLCEDACCELIPTTKEWHLFSLAEKAKMWGHHAWPEAYGPRGVAAGAYLVLSPEEFHAAIGDQ